MGSSAPRTQTVTQQTQLPPWLEDVTRENLARADAISNQPYQPYTGQMTAGFAPEQLQAFDYAQQGIGQTTPLYQQAFGSLSNQLAFQPQQVQAGSVMAQGIGPSSVAAQNVTAPQFTQADIGAYMNPYISNVEEAALSRLGGATQQAVNRIGDQALAARAFGGSRQGIAEGVALGEAARSAGELSANLRAQGFNQAAQLVQADQQRAMQAALANQQANLAAGTTSAQLAQQAALANQATGLQAGQFNAQQALQAQQLNQSAGLQAGSLRNQTAAQLGAMLPQYQQARQLDAAILEDIGQQRQAMNQAALDEAYARFMEQRNYPIEMLNLRLGATSATPYGTTTTGQQLVPRGNSFLTGLGTVGSAAAGIAGLGRLFMSDERMKTDIEKVGKDEDSGLTMYAYRYKGDPKTYPKVVGPMAQEVEKKYPDQVRDVAGRKAVNLGFGPMRKAMRDG